MQIKSHELTDNGMIRIKTKDPDGTFVYFADKFDSIEELEAEINKKIIQNDKIKKMKKDKKDKLESELDAGY